MEEETKDLIIFIVIASSSVVLLLVVVVFDLFLLFRKRKVIAQQEIEIRESKIDELIMKKEVESVNAMLKGQNSERRRISQELHDRLGSILFTAKLYHGNIEKKLNEVKYDQEVGLEKLTALLDEAVQEVRRISHDLYSGSLANFGYLVALRQLTTAIEGTNELRIHLNVEREVENQKEEIQYELYAITQELLSNTLKHSEASEVQIGIRSEDELIFNYHDNGKGFDSNKSYDGIGLRNIQNRAKKLDGKLTIESSPEQGTFYQLSIPLTL